MNEGPFSKHEVKFVVQPRPGLHDGRRVGKTADGATHFGQISARHDCRWLVIDPDLHEVKKSELLMLTKQTLIDWSETSEVFISRRLALENHFFCIYVSPRDNSIHDLMNFSGAYEAANGARRLFNN